ncbi:DegT/DnrJ/EryC1/StrS family aminotransferase [Phaeovulum vinaykumarii]|uniref:dTDP-4-amino-4,6-dideoxygalactose transaminase n=1 Tax=Phaeovulum vinaykumarii TaxID=407234 RepID=A0A1N7KCU5_9RHOB|nr:DegT/DnrJ/EryC1/StrS family aminotransferase [Phaeovulum vinaykumarii]SIS59426.1 dTDP-4-amino-4,6-dideoxygalactose transaminase [Phaeovulum vinaykumarii]SOB94117.1 dTDP-4-amino-4,6-dideoxygalactose transaminase [Phaeovulum vinaykumarii]
MAAAAPLRFSFLDVRFTYDSLRAETDAAIARVMDSGWYIGGPEVTAFEDAFAEYCGARHCVGTGNGLDALVLLLRAAGIGPGDEVIVPAHTFIATWLAVSQAGATPVPVDVDPATMNLDPATVEAAITPATRAVIAVHLYGTPVPCADLRALCARRGLRLFEDAAQAQGAAIDGRRAGAMGDGAGFSFYPGKNLGAFGDAGCVVTNDADLAEAVRMIGNYGARVKYDHEIAGVNSRLDPVQAAVLGVKLRHLDAWTERRRQIADIYMKTLAGVPSLRLPALPEGAAPVWHLFVVRHPRRDALAAALADRGVPTALHYPIANHHSGAYRADFEGRSFPVAEDICATCLSLPIGPHLDLAAAQEIAEIVAETADRQT